MPLEEASLGLDGRYHCAMARRVGFKAAGTAVFAIGLCVSVASQTNSADWPQWRGPNQGRTTSVGFVPPKAWPERLTLRWQIDVGSGYATPFLAGNRIYMFSRQGENDVMAALDAASGKALWRDAVSGAVQMDKAAAPHGPRTEVDAGVCRRQAVLDRYERDRHRVRCRDGQAAVAEARPAGVQPLWTSHSFSPLVDQAIASSFTRAGNDMGTLSAFDVNTGEASVDVEWRWARLWLCRWQYELRGHTPDRDHDPAEVHRAGCRHRRACSGNCPYTTEYAQNIITPGPVRRHASSFPATRSRWWRSGSRSQNAQWNTDAGLGKCRRLPVHERCGAGWRDAGRVFTATKRPVLRPRCPHRQDAVDQRRYVRGPTRRSSMPATSGLRSKTMARCWCCARTRRAFEPLRRYEVAKSATWAQPVDLGQSACS